MKAWQIKDWGKQGKFSTSELERKVNVWRYVPIPCNLTGERFRLLMATPWGQQCFGVFIAIVELACNLPRRGVLADERGPLSDRTISVKIGVPEKVVRKVREHLQSPEFAWFVEIDLPEGIPDEQPESAGGGPDKAGLHPEIVGQHPPKNGLALTKPQPSLPEPTGAKPQPTPPARAVRTLDEVNRQLLARRAQGGGLGHPAANGLGSAVAAQIPGPDGQTVLGLLSRIWAPPAKTAEVLAVNPHATLVRVSWLIHRAGTEQMRSEKGRAGFVRRGIEEGWDVDSKWAADFEARRAQAAPIGATA